MGTILKGLQALLMSGILLKPVTWVGIGVASWLMFFVKNTDDSYMLAKTIIPYLIMGYFSIVFALFSSKSRRNDKLKAKLVIGNSVNNFFISLASFLFFAALINFFYI